MKDNVFYIEAEESQGIDDFINELLENRKNRKRDVIGVYDKVIVLKVFQDTTFDELKEYFLIINKEVTICRRSKFVLENEYKLITRNHTKSDELSLDTVKWALMIIDEFPKHHLGK